MNLLLINQYYPPDTAPTGQYLHQLAKALVKRGHAVTILCSRRAYNGREVYAKEEVLDGVRVRRLGASGLGRASSAAKILDYATFYLSLAARLFSPRRKVDAMLALTTPPHLGLLVAFACRARRIRHGHWVMDIYPDVLAAHGMLDADSWTYKLLAALTRHELKDSPLVLGLGEDMAVRLRAHLRQAADDRSTVDGIPLWSEPSLAPWNEPVPPPFRREQGWTDTDTVLMYSGNMGRGHRLGEFLEAARRTRAMRSIHWVFAGGGKRREEVEGALQADPGLNVKLLPYAPMEKLREHLCSADVHLVSLDHSWQGCMVPSKFQGIFAIGKPVIFVGGADNSLAQWIRESGAGWIVPENDVHALLQAVSEATHPEERRRRGAAARAFCESHFNIDRNIGRIIDLIEQRLKPAGA